LVGVNLIEADLRKASPEGAELCTADLFQSNLGMPDLNGTDPGRENIMSANLKRADLNGI